MNTAPALQLFGPAHVTVIVVSLLAPLTLALVFRRTKGQPLDRMVRFFLATLLICNYVGYGLYQWQRGILHALLKEKRQRWLEVAYFWGIGGSLQALFTPNLQFGFPDCRFFTFFFDHGGIVAGILYLMISRSFRPTLASVWRTLLWSEIYLVLTLAVDHVTGVNYGFLLHKPQVASLLSVLADSRPLYLLQLNCLAIFFFALLYAPFAIADLVRSRGQSVAAVSDVR